MKAIRYVARNDVGWRMLRINLTGEPGFEALPRRRVVERTFGWMVRCRRFVRD